MNKKQMRAVSSALLGLMVASSPVAGMAKIDTANIAMKNLSATSIPKSQLRVGERYFITANSLNIRSSNSTSANNIVGKLSQNDEVEIYNLLNSATPLVQVRIISSASVSPNAAPELFVSKDYLSPKAITTAASQYFVIQNVATEKTRVYERCVETPNCPHRLVMETDMVVGRPEEGTKIDRRAFITWLGHAKVSEWVKFYQDLKAHYPHWYRAGQDISSIPGRITGGGSKMLNARKWTTKDGNGNSTIYGAFGWYAAKITPADDVNGMNYQWMHGTIGWGADGSSSIDLTRGFLMNLFSNPGSAGCTRLENRAIAYLRELLPVGTDIYRVYALESTREKDFGPSRPLSRYAHVVNGGQKWDYILLTNDAQKANGLTADARTIIERAIPVLNSNLIERGTYDVDQYPNAVPLNFLQTASSGKSGDRYGIDSSYNHSSGRSNFRGYFLVDEGRFVDYAHPSEAGTKGKVRISGYTEFRTRVPDFLKTSGAHNPPEVVYQSNNNDWMNTTRGE